MRINNFYFSLVIDLNKYPTLDKGSTENSCSQMAVDFTCLIAISMLYEMVHLMT